MRLTLKSITCRRTYGEIVEEPWLKVFVDDDIPSSGEALGGTGGYPMRTGESSTIDWTREFDTLVKVELWECDDTRFGILGPYNHLVDDFLVYPDSRGRYTVVLGADLSSPRGRHYTITYEVTEDESDQLEEWCLKLDTIKCNDAQEAEDEVFLKVDDQNVWGPVSMKTHDTLSLNLRPIAIRSSAMIEVWERDTSGRSDFIAHFRLEINDEFDISNNHQQRFSRDDGIVGDATYTLWYHVRRKDTMLGGC
jgi:hypothetical protein